MVKVRYDSFTSSRGAGLGNVSHGSLNVLALGASILSNSAESASNSDRTTSLPGLHGLHSFHTGAMLQVEALCHVLLPLATTFQPL